jgi:hypothetical protein
VVEIGGLIDEIDRLIARAPIVLAPSSAAIAVDGRPLEARPARAGEAPVLVAGLRAPGAGEPPPRGSFTLLLDPGLHVILLSRKGFTDAVVKREFAPGSTTPLRLVLDRLPATLHVSSNRSAATVTVDGVDVGTTPVELRRPAGVHRVVVRQKGYAPYRTELALEAGQELELRAELAEDRSIVRRWWFWTALGGALTGAGIATYFALSDAPRVDTGALDWSVEAH